MPDVKPADKPRRYRAVELIVDQMLSIYGARFDSQFSRLDAVETWARQLAEAAPSSGGLDIEERRLIATNAYNAAVYEAAKLCEALADRRVEGQEYSDYESARWGACIELEKHIRSLALPESAGPISQSEYPNRNAGGQKGGPDETIDRLTSEKPRRETDYGY